MKMKYLHKCSTNTYNAATIYKWLSRGAQTHCNTGILNITYFPFQVVYLLSMYSLLIVIRRATVISSYRINNIFLLSRRLFCNITNILTKSHCRFFMQCWYWHHRYIYLVPHRSTDSTEMIISSTSGNKMITEGQI